MLRSWNKGMEIGITPSAFGLKLRDGSFKQVPWSGHDVAAGVRALVTEMNGATGRISLVLSNHFMRYLVLPWNDALSGDTEWLAYARHQFATIYGVDAQLSQIRMARQPFGKPQMVAAVDAKILADLLREFEMASLQIEQIHPYLMVAFNMSRKRFIEDDFWFAVLESGRVYLAKFNQKAWSYVGVRSLENGEESAECLHKIMMREIVRLPDDLANTNIYVHAPTIKLPLSDLNGVELRPFSFAESGQVMSMRHFGMVF